MTDKTFSADEAISEAELDALRESAKKRTYLAYALAALAFPLYWWLFYTHEFADGGGSAMMKNAIAAAVASAGTFGFLHTIVARRAHARFVESFKAKYVLPVIGALPGFSQLEFRSREGFEWEEVRDAAVVKCGDKKYFKREDLLTGLYEGVRFRISDVTARRMVKKEKKRELQTLFEGQVMCFSRFDDTKKSDGFVQVFRRELFTDTGGARAEHKIMTENAAFNDIFNVFAEDEHNAYYILTPQLIGKIMEFSEAAGAPVSLVFVGEKLYAAVERRGMFVPVLDEPVGVQKERLGGDIAVLRKAAELLIDLPE